MTATEALAAARHILDQAGLTAYQITPPRTATRWVHTDDHGHTTAYTEMPHRPGYALLTTVNGLPVVEVLGEDGVTDDDAVPAGDLERLGFTRETN
ncbi:hypothetical protein ABZ799_01150 [Nocardiopsis dassonvillei]|uniref:hypothetical protein n=1 Tax=Nocardiopsis dassonvillei TaxID=2014 RepID=UPI0033EC4C7F